MDEQKLMELFREAVRDTPPASFEARDVTYASQRIAQRRRRSAVVAGTIAAVLVFGAVAVGMSQLLRPEVMMSNGGLGAARTAAPYTGPATAEGSPSVLRAPQSGDKASGDAAAAAACGPVDRDLADALAAALPAAAGQQPVQVVGPCPPGARAAGYVVRDGATTGVFSVVLAPAQHAPPSIENSRPPGTAPRGAVCIETGCTVTTATGKQLAVRSTPNPRNPGQAPVEFVGPFADRVAAVALQLASRF